MYDFLGNGQWVDVTFCWAFLMHLLIAGMIVIVPAGFTMGFFGQYWSVAFSYTVCIVLLALTATATGRHIHKVREENVQDRSPLPKEYRTTGNETKPTDQLGFYCTPQQEQSYSDGYSASNGYHPQVDFDAPFQNHRQFQVEEVTYTRRTSFR